MIVFTDLQLTQQDSSPTRKTKIELVCDSVPLSGQPFIPSDFSLLLNKLRNNGNAYLNESTNPTPQSLEKTGNSIGSIDEKILTEEEINNMSLLMASFKKEHNKLQRIESKKNSAQAFSYLSKVLYRLPFQNCAVEINSDETIKFSLLFEDSKLLMVTKEMGNQNLEIKQSEVFYSYFINKKLIASDVTNLEVFTESFKGYIVS